MADPNAAFEIDRNPEMRAIEVGNKQPKSINNNEQDRL